MSEMNDKQLDELLHDAFADVHAPRQALARTRETVRDCAKAVAPETGSQPLDSTFEVVHPHAAGRKEPPAETKAAPAQTSSRRVATHRWAIAAAVAACLLAIAFVPLGFHALRDVTTVVSVDVNPSVELSLNRFDRVVAARGMNDDGDKLLEAVSVQGMSCDEAVRALLASDAVRKAASESNPVEVVVSSLDGSDTHELETQLNRACASTGCAARCSSAHAGERETASELGLTVGKYRMYQVLHDHGCDIDAETASSMTMRQLRDLAAQYGCDESDESAADGGGHRDGCGNGVGMHANPQSNS